MHIQLLPSGKQKQFAIENGTVEIVDLPIKNGGSFHSYMLVYQWVNHVNHVKSYLFPHLKSAHFLTTWARHPVH
jgi:hypothetical protein